jgi:septal ring factor EnvC (AmiA/AmiB activator)
MDVSVNGLKHKSEAAKGVTNGHGATDNGYKHFHEQLEQIARYLEQEIAGKQQTIEEQRQEIEKLRSEIDVKTRMIADLEQQLNQSARHTEGHRQLINKLLNDITHFQNDIDWYKRTYERRSIWGVLKEKLGKKK